MTRLAWNDQGARVYEAGVDRGVLYIEDGSGIAWNGLVSITETPSGGEPRDYYLDGIKYLSLVSLEEFGAKIEAFTYPDEFAQCDGTESVANGLFVTQQYRKPFSLSYRTKLGNDIMGMNYGYKIHLIYNATAAPSSQTRSTIGDSVEPSLFSWEASTRPPPLAGYNATAHFIIDSTKTPTDLLRSIEDILYGNQNKSARLPNVQELIQLFKSFTNSIPTDPTPVKDVLDAGVPVTTPTTNDTVLDGGTPDSNTSTSLDGGTL